MAGEGLVVESEVGALKKGSEEKGKSQKTMGEEGGSCHRPERLGDLHGHIVEACGHSPPVLSHESDRQGLPGPDRTLIQGDPQDMGQNRQGECRHERNQKGKNKSGPSSGNDGGDRSEPGGKPACEVGENRREEIAAGHGDPDGVRSFVESDGKPVGHERGIETERDSVQGVDADESPEERPLLPKRFGGEPGWRGWTHPER